MDGLLHNLFKQKFNQRGLRWVHYLMRSFDFLYLLSLYILAMMIRLEPHHVLSPPTAASHPSSGYAHARALTPD